MIKSGRVTVWGVALFLALISVSAVRRLYSIDDLNRIDFGRSVPEHSRVLLHWFADAIEIDDNDIWLNFDPNQGDYGSHYYGNYDQLLPYGHTYYTIGNLYNNRSPVQLPPSVINHRTAGVGRNRARIIVSVRGQNAGHRIDQVYITQHYEAFQREGAAYDPDHTYEISTHLLRELRQSNWISNPAHTHEISTHLLRELRPRNWISNVCFICIIFVCVVLAFAIINILTNVSQTKSKWL